MKTDAVEVSTERTVYELGRLLQDAAQAVRALAVNPIQSGSGALAAFDDHADIEVAVEGKTLVGGLWAVQVFVVDQGEHRHVLLVALGDGVFTRAVGGARNTLSLSASIRKRDDIAAALR